MADVKKQWKEREEFSISELEDLWFSNRNLEMARSIILAVKDFQKISLEEKLGFLQSIFYQQSNQESNQRKLEKYIHGPLLETFLFLLPEWKQEFAKKTANGRLNLVLLSYKDIYSYMNVSAGQIKKFVHSYMNSVKKADIEEYLIVEVLINNRMFEELVNYNLISNGTIKKLWEFVFKQNIKADENYSHWRVFESDYLKEAEKKKRIKELLLSWDKVENRHALATLWTLLVKRGDLEKIFGAEQVQK